MDKTNNIAIGIDLGDRMSDVCVLDGGKVVGRERVAMTREAFHAMFGGLVRCPVAIEAGAQCAWVAAILQELGFDVVVANSRRLAVISTNTRKNDRNDAEMLARLVAADRTLLSPVQLRADAHQRVLELMGSRDTLVRARTQLTNTVRSRAKGVGVRLKSTDADSFALHEASVPQEIAASAAPLFRVIRGINEEIAEIDTRLEEIAERDYPVAALLQSVPGVGPLTAMAFTLVLGETGRFRNGRIAAAYLGLVPRLDQSGKTDRQLGISKAGNDFLRRLLVQCAQVMLGKRGADSELRRWGLRLMERGGKSAKKRAVAAVARKLAVVLFTMWKREVRWNPFPTAAATPQEPNTPAEGCPDVPVFDDCVRVLGPSGRPADCSIEAGSDPSMHQAPSGLSKSADRSVDHGAPSTGASAPATQQAATSDHPAATPARHQPAPNVRSPQKTASGAQTSGNVAPPDRDRSAKPGAQQKSASRAFGGEMAGNVAPSDRDRSTMATTQENAVGGPMVP